MSLVRAVRVIAVLIVLCLFMAGCLQLADRNEQDDPDDPSDGGSGQTHGSDRENDQDQEDDPDAENETRDPEDPDEGDEPGEDGKDRPACHEQEKTQGRYPPAPPDEQEVDSVESILCPGHFAVTDEGSGGQWEVPTWQTGDWWSYQRDQINQTAGYACHQQFHERVNGTGESWGVDVYRMDLEWYDCNENPERAHSQNRTQSSLSEFSDQRWGEGKDHGYVNHFVLFPLRDGKEWSFMNAPGHVVESQVSHRPNYLFRGEVQEAWRIESTINNATIIQWYGVQEGNLLREELRMNGVVWYYTYLVDSGTGS